MSATITHYNNTPIPQMYTIFESEDNTERELAFDVDELVDIVHYGCSAGVSGLVYTRDCVQWFNENEDDIEEYLSDWHFDHLGERNYMMSICESTEPCSIDELKTKMVWMYVELKAFDILNDIKHPSVY